MLNETSIIQALSLKSHGFIGDDAAVLPNTYSHLQHYVITKDLLIEDVHFRTCYVAPQDLAHKALHVNLSDLAAMGAAPQYILCGIALPESCESYAQSFLQHLPLACKEANVILIGGDTTRAPDTLCISITAIGTATADRIKYRRDAKASDIVCVAGHLGFAHLGLMALEKNIPGPAAYTQAFLRPKAKIAEGLWLGQQPFVNSLMDISDGLLIDLQRLCHASNAACVIALEQCTYDQQFLATCHNLGLDPIDVMLTGGEDYGLLFTVQADDFERLARAFFTKFGYSLKGIGHIAPGASVSFTQHGECVTLSPQPFTHFGEK